ncbi:MAG: hypothetical protein MR269_04490 [Clostridiales bacterium]|nr:hypothetical protein [Clostridiales bacterium]MDY4060602.1 sugar-transfer associated ATP-grasp domain-containing protein [Anaerovoracaceae bacterium]
MINIRYLLKRMKDSDFSKYKDAAARISNSTGRGKHAILADMIISTIRYGSGPVDYETFEMFNMNAGEKADVLTIGKNNTLVKELNDPKFLPYFEDKYEFILKFNKYINRSWAMIGDSEEHISDFLKDKDRIIVKPLDECCGRGIRILNLNEYDSVESLISELKEHGTPLMEEIAIQSDLINKVYPYSINTVRIVTILNDDKVNIVGSCFRVGRNGNSVDNFNHGGIASIIDYRTGKIVTDGFDKYRNEYIYHPDTGVKFKGFQIPGWDNIRVFLEEVAHIVPEVRYVGWDIALDQDNKPFLIEGNGYPGQDVTQYPKLGLGNYAVMKEALK